MANNNQIYKMSNAGGVKSLTRYSDMLAGNTVWNPWQPAGAFDALATVTVPSGGVASVTFAGIPTGYKHLQLRMLVNGGGGNVPMRFNGDSGNNYSVHYINGDGGSASAGAFTSQPTFYASLYAPTTGSNFAGAVVDILDYANSNKYKTVRILAGGDTNGGGNIQLVSGLWMNTTAVTSLVLTGGANFNQYSSFALFGVK